ncbi:MAG: hypothetical protein ABFD54_01700 [Armatimonadota bacterium]|nr:hypothetical protein [bacterium]
MARDPRRVNPHLFFDIDDEWLFGDEFGGKIMVGGVNPVIVRSAMHRTYTEEERERIVDFVSQLRNAQLREFLEVHDLEHTGIREDLQKQMRSSLKRGKISYNDLVDLLDRVGPWDKQHVFLYTGPTDELALWRDEQWVLKHMQERNVDRYLNQQTRLILPSTLTPSSVEYNSKKIRITAVERRDDYIYDRDLNLEPQQRDGAEVHYRAYVHVVSRGLVMFEWDLVSNNAMLQITQLESGSKYEEREKCLKALVQDWFPMGQFKKLSLRRAVKRLDDAAARGGGEARIQGISYKMGNGACVSGKCATRKDSVYSEPTVSAAINAVRHNGLGDSGNLYWLPDYSGVHNDNPLAKEIHVEIIANKNRINFRRANSEGGMRYVLRRVRELSV